MRLEPRVEQLVDEVVRASRGRGGDRGRGTGAATEALTRSGLEVLRTVLPELVRAVNRGFGRPVLAVDPSAGPGVDTDVETVVREGVPEPGRRERDRVVRDVAALARTLSVQARDVAAQVRAQDRATLLRQLTRPDLVLTPRHGAAGRSARVLEGRVTS